MPCFLHPSSTSSSIFHQSMCNRGTCRTSTNNDVVIASSKAQEMDIYYSSSWDMMSKWSCLQIELNPTDHPDLYISDINFQLKSCPLEIAHCCLSTTISSTLVKWCNLPLPTHNFKSSVLWQRLKTSSMMQLISSPASWRTIWAESVSFSNKASSKDPGWLVTLDPPKVKTEEKLTKNDRTQWIEQIWFKRPWKNEMKICAVENKEHNVNVWIHIENLQSKQV